jgi:hypothetical protein
VRRLLAAAFATLLAAAAAAPAAARTLIVASQNGTVIAVADGERREIHRFRGGSQETFAGVRHPAAVAISASGAIAVVDALANELVVAGSGKPLRLSAGESPVAVAFAGETAIVLSRDSTTLTAVGPDGSSRSAATPQGSSLLAVTGDSIVVASPVTGELRVYSPALAPRGSVVAGRGAAALAVSGRRAFLVHPADALVTVVDLGRMEIAATTQAGAVPADLVLSASSPLAAPTMIVTDPSSKAIWRIEAHESALAAFGRGFLRGLIGLGISGVRPEPTAAPIDRLYLVEGRLFGLDSAGRVLYLLGRRGGSVVARDAGAGEFVIQRDGSVLMWDSEARRLRSAG